VAAQLLRSQLYGVHPRDPLTYAAASALVLAGALMACWIPVRRATAISPLEALRSE
jgi:putative ABC transport system permease protein